MADIDTEVQTFGFQSLSLSTSPLSPDNKLKERVGDEYQSTVAFDDTVALESPLLEAQLENLDFDTEVLDIPGCVENTRTPMLDNIEDEVVLDSDDDRMHRTEVVSAMNESCFDMTDRRFQGDALNSENKQHTPSQKDKDVVAGSFATDGKQCFIGYTRRRFSSVSTQRVRSSGLAGLNMPYKGSNSGPISIHSDSHSQKQLVAENCETSRVEHQFSDDRNIKVVVQNHENALNESKGSSISCEAKDVLKDTPRRAHDHELAKLKFSVSQESEESSQANVLDFVDRYLSMNNVSLSPEVSTKKTNRDKSPPVLSAKGPQRFARKANIRATVGESGIFEWDENQIDGVEVTLIQKKKELVLDCQGHGPVSAKRSQSAKNLNIQKQANLDVQFEEKLREEITGRNHSYSSLMVQNSDDDEVEQRSEMGTSKNIMELDEQFNAESSGQQLEDRGIERHVPDVFDVGFDTQMAAEAMEALLHAPPPNYNADCAHQGPQKMCEGSPKVATKNNTSNCCSLSKRPCFDSEVTARKPKRTKRISKKLVGDTTTSNQTPPKKQKDLSSVEYNSCGEELTLGKCRNISNVASRTRRWSSVTLLKKPESPINSSGERKKDTTESCVLKERRKGNNLNADALQMLSDKVSQQVQTDIEIAATDSYLKLDTWSYLRGKRRCRSVPGHSNGASNKCGPLKVTVGKKAIVHSFGSNMLPEGNSKIDFFSIDVKRKARSSVYTRQCLSSSEKKCDKSLLRQSFDEPNSANKGGEVGNQACKRTLPRSPFMKELIRLGIAESLHSFASKDLRRRRHMANVRVLFSQNLDVFIIKQQKKILTRLGISIASCCSDATHFIADRFVRTRNMLEAIALGKPVVTHLWLESCGQASCFIDEKNYILRDAKKEKELGFSMPVSLARASQHPLLEGRRVFITPNVKPSIEMIAGLVKTVQGQVMDRVHKAATKVEMIQDGLLVLSCEQDYAMCVPFLEKEAAVYSSELLLNGIVTQKIEYERHQLFTNHIKRSCSRKCPNKDGSQPLPSVKRR